MENSSNAELFLDYFTQTKQRIDLDIDMESTKIIGRTKLTFQSKNRLIGGNNAGGKYTLKLNAENMIINKILLYNGELKDNQPMESQFLLFHNSNPFYTKTYLEALYNNIEDIDSFRNVNRVEWALRNEGNIVISITGEQLKGNSKDNCNNNNNNKSNSDKDKDKGLKVKIVIEYEVIENDIGVVFQSFFDERIDIDYNICYTPNFYLNTSNWVPVIYDLKSHILWRIYLLLPKDHSAFCSCQLNTILEDNHNSKRMFIYFSKEPMTARNIGFIVLNDKIFNKVFDFTNKNVVFLVNENKKEKVEKNLISNGLINSISSFYEDFFDTNELEAKSNLTSNTFIVFIPYIIFNSSNEHFTKFFYSKEEHYFNMIKYPHLYILPDAYIYTSTIPEIMKFQLRNLSKLFITNYIGGLINESTFSDFWLINGIECWMSDLFLQKCYGSNYLKSKIYHYIRKFKSKCKKGLETKPLWNNYYTHPMEVQLSEIGYLKSKIILHLLEAQVEKIFVQKALKNIINERLKNGYNLSTDSFIKIFKKNCGINLKHFMNLWVFKTGMLELNVSYSYNKRTNSIDIEVHQQQMAKEYYNNNPYFKIKDIDYNLLMKYNKNIQVIDFKVKPVRYFDVFLNLNIYQTNGIEIMRDTHQIKLETEKDSYYANYPLISKIRKMPIKKREQEFIQDLISNTSIVKLFSNEDIEKIFTQNSIMWLRIDAELTNIGINIIQQQHIIYDYIKLFKEGDVVGQMESLRNMKRDKETYTNSLIILETFIRSNGYYKLRLYAIKVYMKIILKLKNENGYQFLIDYLDDCYMEILKNKSQLNYDTYFIMKEIIKYLGEYREDYFNQFFVIGRVTNSSIQNKIINKFLSILVSNELNIITGFNDCYIMSEILIGCSRLNLQEKSFILLKKIIKNLRIEKLKRSFNEITIIASIQAFLNLLILNDFYQTKKDYLDIVNEINTEVNHYVNSDCENYELLVFLNYFQTYFIFYKSKSFIEFSNNLKYYVLGSDYNNPLKNIKLSISTNSSIIVRLKALFFLFQTVNFKFENVNEKIQMLTAIKEILYSPKCYVRIDCRVIIEKIYVMLFNKQIELSGAGNNNFSNLNFIHILNKNWTNYAGKKYADEDWLYAFIKEDKQDKNDLNNLSEISSETHSKFGFTPSNQMLMIKKYQNKYKGDTYAILNCEIDTDKPWIDICNTVIENLLGHPLASNFSYELNEENLGDLYQQYISSIKHPIDLSTIHLKLGDGQYKNIAEFTKDVQLVFSNCKAFNVKGSELYDNAVQLEEYFKIMNDIIKKANIQEKNGINNNNTNMNISINMNNQEMME